MRHNLTQNDCFRQILRDPSKPNGKGNFWTVSVEEISGEMYKRQNTSVAYQAPEGKTYVADLRQVYDFYAGMPKMGIEYDPNNPLSLFEKTILQDVHPFSEKSHPDPTTPSPMPSQAAMHPAFHGFSGFGSLRI